MTTLTDGSTATGKRTKRKGTHTERVQHPIEDAVIRLTKFYYSPWGAAKTALWESITDLPFSDRSYSELVTRLVVSQNEKLRHRILEVLK